VYHLLDIFLCAALAKPMQQNTSCTTNGVPPFVVYAAGVPPAASQLLLRSKTKEGISCAGLWDHQISTSML